MMDVQSSSYGCQGVVVLSLVLLLKKLCTQSAFKYALSSISDGLAQ